MTMLEYIKGIDKEGKIVYPDATENKSSIYININQLHKHEDGERLLSILSTFIPPTCPFYTPYENSEESIQHITGAPFEFLKSTNIVIDEEVYNYDSSAKRPYYKMRGKRVTEQQALEIISRADQFWNYDLKHDKYVYTFHFTNWWIARSHYGYGWCHPNGIIGLNGITDRYPNILELIEDAIRLKYAFPYLDLVIAITGWEERPPEWYDWQEEIEKIKDKKERAKAERELPYREYPNFLDNIEIGIWIHSGAIEFLGPARAKEKYTEYEGLYSELNREVYIPQYYKDHNLHPITPEYLKRCIAHCDLNPNEENVKKLIEQGDTNGTEGGLSKYDPT